MTTSNEPQTPPGPPAPASADATASSLPNTGTRPEDPSVEKAPTSGRPVWRDVTVRGEGFVIGGLKKSPE